MSGIETSANMNDAFEENISQRYLDAEAKWIDEEFTKNWPKIYTKFAHWASKKANSEKGIGFIGRLLVVFMAKCSGLTIHRNRHANFIMGKGFRPGHGKTVLEAITVTLLKRKKEVAKKRFELSIFR